MGYVTRKGTRVLHPRSARAAITAEVYHDAAEYVVYRRFVHRDFVGDEGDGLLIHSVDHARFADHAHVVNLVNGCTSIVPWDTMAHSIKPADVKSL